MRSTIPAQALLAVVVLAMVCAFQPASAQSWNWQMESATAGRSSALSHSRVSLSTDAVRIDYSARVGQHDITIDSCTIPLRDIATVRTVKSAVTNYFFVQLKADRPAHCASGQHLIAVVPVEADASARAAVSAVAGACCGAAPVRAGSPAPSVAPPRLRVARAAPVPPEPAPAGRVNDWVERSGAFAFVRVRNHGTQAVTLAGGTVERCRNIDAGCGTFAPLLLAPATTATLATLMLGSSGDPAFVYHYTLHSGTERTVVSGWTDKAPHRWEPPMTQRQLRAAETAALRGARPIAAAGASPVPTPQADAAVRLMRRGTSRLAIGQTGTAQLRVTVDANGTPAGATIVRISNGRLSAAAIETAVSSSYAPAIRGGHPVAETYIATFQFDGSDPALAAIPVWQRPATPAPEATASGS